MKRFHHRLPFLIASTGTSRQNCSSSAAANINVVRILVRCCCAALALALARGPCMYTSTNKLVRVRSDLRYLSRYPYSYKQEKSASAMTTGARPCGWLGFEQALSLDHRPPMTSIPNRTSIRTWLVF
eukprot:scaffold591009_cov19-Prasinocladus_malaysianus.AAC.1